MKLVFLNWRDGAHPRAGGAEYVAQGIAARCARDGHDVDFFAAHVAGRPSEEVNDGLRIVRRGNRYSVYLEAYNWLKQRVAEYDFVVDQINTVPFFSPLYAKGRAVSLIHQLAREVWFTEASFPMNVVGYIAEPSYLRVYQNVPSITVSQSTAADLRSIGWQAPITVIREPLEPAFSSAHKCSKPTFIYVGRLTQSKRLEDVIDAFRLITGSLPDAQLWIVGAGDSHYVSSLKARCAGLSAQVTFWGRVDQTKRTELMSAAHVLLITSLREGWGLVVTEANIAGTPAVGYDVPGLRDSISAGFGRCVPPRDIGALSRAALEVFRQTDYTELKSSARELARRFNWSSTMSDFYQGLERANEFLGC
jgi:glycosyltransferase involved in cell wall biosynthesis